MSTAALKIGLVLDDSLDKTDGVQQYVLALGDWFSGQGHEVHYLVGETRRIDKPRIHSLSRNMKVRFNGNRMSMPLPGRRSHLKRLLQEESFDILHVQLPYSPFLAARLIHLSNTTTAVIGTFHILPNSKLATTANRLLSLWLRRSLKRFDEVVSVSAAAASFAREIYGLETTVVPNGFDYERFHNAAPLLTRKPTEKTILFLGRLVPRKGCQLLLEAVHTLLKDKKVPGIKVLICGTGPLEQQLRKFVAKRDLSAHVEFKGYIAETDKPGVYASADVAVFPSSGGESFGIVLLEAMASGRAAVLAGDNPGYSSVMDEQTELLFDPSDSAQLAEKLFGLLVHEDRRQHAAEWGATYSRRFDSAEIGRKLENVYNKALHSRRNVR